MKPAFSGMTCSMALLLLSAVASADGVMNANTADADGMTALPHMTADLAAIVVANRPYSSIGSLDALLGKSLSDEQREALYATLFVPIKLNSADESDILLIPGVGRRMAHEFEEYRPYSSIEQFRREMGKYVDEEEVARLEQYVVLD
jgi:DNA uptake protein ComE-like DNA-binding protein